MDFQSNLNFVARGSFETSFQGALIEGSQQINKQKIYFNKSIFLFNTF